MSDNCQIRFSGPLNKLPRNFYSWDPLRMDGESQKREIGFKEIRKKWNLILFKAALQIVAELETGARGQSCFRGLEAGASWPLAVPLTPLLLLDSWIFFQNIVCYFHRNVVNEVRHSGCQLEVWAAGRAARLLLTVRTRFDLWIVWVDIGIVNRYVNLYNIWWTSNTILDCRKETVNFFQAQAGPGA